MLGDMQRWMRQRQAFTPQIDIQWAPTKCHGLVVNTMEKNLRSPSLEGKQIICRDTNRPVSDEFQERKERARDGVVGCPGEVFSGGGV